MEVTTTKTSAEEKLHPVEFHSTIPGGPDAGAPHPTVGIVPTSVLSRRPEEPTCNAGGPYTAECTGDVTVVELTGTGPENDGDGLTFLWETDCPGAVFDNPASQTTFVEITNASAALECTVQLLVTDASGNESECDGKVAITDTMAPTIDCSLEVSVNAEVDCRGELPDLAATTEASDACTPTDAITVDQTPPVGTLTDLGAHTVTISATDPSGNSSECAVTVTVVDATPPELTCPLPFSSDPTDGCTFVGSIDEATATDNCSAAAAITIESDAPSTFEVGTTLVTWTATDEAGNFAECTSTVTIHDDIPPTINCLGSAQVDANSGCSFVGPLDPPTTTDNCDVPGDITLESNAPGSLPFGSTAVTWTATDLAGNSTSCVTTVTVVDTVPPVLTCLPESVVEAGGACEYDAAITPPVAADNCTATPDIALSNDAPAVFSLGSTEVTWTAVDAAGNSASCVSTVTVVDSLSPVLTCPADIAVDPNAGCSYVGAFGEVSATDACSPQESIAITNNAPGSFPAGTTELTWTAADEAGNMSSCTQLVVVGDATPPQLICTPSLTFDMNVACGYVGTFGSPFVDDNCTPAEDLLVTNDAPGVFPVGSTEVEWSATDSNGNTAICTSTVVVIDNKPPTLICAPVVTASCDAGEGTAVDFPITVSDNCDDLLEATCSTASGSIFPVGTTIVSCAAVDSSGNRGTCEIEVRVGCGGILPGDCNQDGFVGVSDSICLLNVLFGGGGFSAVELPCSDHAASDPANRALLSWDNEPSLGLSDAIGLLNWRFFGGPPHPLGTACQRIDGCPDICALDP